MQEAKNNSKFKKKMRGSIINSNLILKEGTNIEW